MAEGDTSMSEIINVAMDVSKGEYAFSIAEEALPVDVQADLRTIDRVVVEVCNDVLFFTVDATAMDDVADVLRRAGFVDFAGVDPDGASFLDYMRRHEDAALPQPDQDAPEAFCTDENDEEVDPLVDVVSLARQNLSSFITTPLASVLPTQTWRLAQMMREGGVRAEVAHVTMIGAHALSQARPAEMEGPLARYTPVTLLKFLGIERLTRISTSAGRDSQGNETAALIQNEHIADEFWTLFTRVLRTHRTTLAKWNDTRCMIVAGAEALPPWFLHLVSDAPSRTGHLVRRPMTFVFLGNFATAPVIRSHVAWLRTHNREAEQVRKTMADELRKNIAQELRRTMPGGQAFQTRLDEEVRRAMADKDMVDEFRTRMKKQKVAAEPLLAFSCHLWRAVVGCRMYECPDLEGRPRNPMYDDFARRLWKGAPTTEDEHILEAMSQRADATNVCVMATRSQAMVYNDQALRDAIANEGGEFRDYSAALEGCTKTNDRGGAVECQVPTQGPSNVRLLWNHVMAGRFHPLVLQKILLVRGVRVMATEDVAGHVLGACGTVTDLVDDRTVNVWFDGDEAPVPVAMVSFVSGAVDVGHLNKRTTPSSARYQFRARAMPLCYAHALPMDMLAGLYLEHTGLHVILNNRERRASRLFALALSCGDPARMSVEMDESYNVQRLIPTDSVVAMHSNISDGTYLRERQHDPRMRRARNPNSDESIPDHAAFATPLLTILWRLCVLNTMKDEERASKIQTASAHRLRRLRRAHGLSSAASRRSGSAASDVGRHSGLSTSRTATPLAGRGQADARGGSGLRVGGEPTDCFL